MPCTSWVQGGCHNTLFLQHQVLGKDTSGNSVSAVVSSALENRLMAPRAGGNKAEVFTECQRGGGNNMTSHMALQQAALAAAASVGPAPP